jgi:hypothetical protein
MKKVGQGWQYTVYDLGGGRVLKRYNTWLEAYGVMLRDSFLHIRLPVVFFSRYYKEGKERALRSLTFIQNSTIDPAVFGNPKLLEGSSYEQDNITPLRKYLATCTYEEGRAVIDAFAGFNLMLLQQSVIEMNCNVADNFGLNPQGKMVLIDLGEICTDKEEIQSQIRKRVWSAADVVSGLPAGLRSYFVEKMDAVFSSYLV